MEKFFQDLEGCEKILCRVKDEERASQQKWDRRFLEMARLVSTFSKDPSTQTGAVIVDEDRRVVSVGFNGFARGVDDDPARYADREKKYKFVVHCEINSIIFAQRSLKNHTLYTYPFMSCSRCAGPVIQAGITRCVAPVATPDQLTRWADEFAISRTMFAEAGIIVEEVIL